MRGVNPTRRSALLMIDIDHFKRVNDTHGHQIGDQVLQHAARLIRAGLRQHDRAGRLGGEEFAVLLDDVDVETALVLAERLRGKRGGRQSRPPPMPARFP
jgi:diguanylate cyclase (GGDEF)-like protein